MKIALATIALVLGSIAYSDVLPTPTSVTVTGDAANQLGEMFFKGIDENGSKSSGRANVNCTLKADAINYTCVITKAKK